MQILPLNSDGSRRVTVDLGEVGEYTFITKFNTSSSAWHMDILDADDNVIVYGQALFVGFNILRAYPGLRDDFNELRVISLDADVNNRADDSLGSTGFAVQFDAGELPEPTGIQLPGLLTTTNEVTPTPSPTPPPPPILNVARFQNVSDMQLSNSNLTAQLAPPITAMFPAAWFSDLATFDGIEFFGVYFNIDVDSFQDTSAVGIGWSQNIDLSVSLPSGVLSLQLLAVDVANNEFQVNLGELINGGAGDIVGPVTITYTGEQMCVATNGNTVRLYIGGDTNQTPILSVTPINQPPDPVTQFGYLHFTAAGVADPVADPHIVNIIENPLEYSGITTLVLP